MIKHVGKHNDKKVVIVFRQIPQAEHMALVLYSDLLPRLVHDEVMKALESPQGQATQDLSDVLFRTVMGDGNNCLETLHRQGFLKKVPTNQVLVTPTSTAKVRLDELNDLLTEMKKGDDAVAKLQEIDSSRGLTGKRAPRQAEIQEIGERTTREAQGNTSAADMLSGVLTDADLNASKVSQADRMEADAMSMLAEAKRLRAEAGVTTAEVKSGGAKTTTKKTTATKAKKKQAA